MDYGVGLGSACCTQLVLDRRTIYASLGCKEGRTRHILFSPLMEGTGTKPSLDKVALIRTKMLMIYKLINYAFMCHVEVQKNVDISEKSMYACRAVE